MRKINHLIYLAICAPLLLSACGGDENEASQLTEPRGDDTLVGTCVHIYQDPLISITSAQEAETGYAIDQVHISNITLAGEAVDLHRYPQDNLSNFTLDTDGNGGYCSLPCAFLEGEGTVSFDVSANGYQTKTVELEGEYQTFNGGCPSYSSDGVLTAIELTPVN